MKSISLSMARKPNVHHTNILVGAPESQLIDLQELFLIPGIHYLHVDSIEEGRSLIYEFLQALRYHNQVGCFTNSKLALKSEIIALYEKLHLPEIKTLDLEYYFDQEFDLDLLWIENHQIFLTNPWYYYFLNKLEQLQYPIPIIILLTPDF